MAKILVPVICPTRDYQGAVAQSIVTIWNALWLMGREPAYVQFGAHGYAFVRSGCFAGLRDQFKVDSMRGLMIDDDILIKSQQELIDAITIADKYKWNFVAPYRVRDGYTTIADKDGTLLTVDEVRKFQPWDRIEKAGLGFYYGDLPLTYKFHENAPHGGEDLNFWADNPQLEPRIVDLELVHLKVMPLGLETLLPDPPPRTKQQFDLTDKYFAKDNTVNISGLMFPNIGEANGSRNSAEQCDQPAE